MTNTSKKFSWRAFISFGLTYSFIIIFLTGIVLYLAPAGRIAQWVNWRFAGFSKDEWQAIHTIFSYLFVILSIFHLFTANWKTFVSYLKNKTQNGLNKKRELFISTILTIAIFLGILFSVPPFSSVMDLGEYLKSSWENEESTPPIAHAELLTLTELVVQLNNMPIEKIEEKLIANKIKFENINQTLAEIAAINKITPNELYNIISKKSGAGMPGAGMGKKTLADIAVENNKDVDELINLLKDKNIIATKDKTLKAIAEEYDMAAKDIHEIILPTK
ncbi:MAG: DUF4405 domain-containing protein [Bacteroidetes bacterium]|nr:DUF4405 domain-containing protein [Bacteroidota bacterium]